MEIADVHSKAFFSSYFQIYEVKASNGAWVGPTSVFPRSMSGTCDVNVTDFCYICDILEMSNMLDIFQRNEKIKKYPVQSYS